MDGLAQGVLDGPRQDKGAGKLKVMDTEGRKLMDTEGGQTINI